MRATRAFLLARVIADEAYLKRVIALARRHDEKVLVEEFVTGTEVECGVLGNLRPPPIASVVSNACASIGSMSSTP